MYKKVCFVIIIFFLIFLNGCASAELEDSGNTGRYYIEELEKDNGRYINKAFGSDKFYFKINASINLTNTELKEGRLKARALDKAMIEQILCDGESLEQGKLEGDQSISANNVYVSKSKELNNPFGHDIVYFESQDSMGDAVFSNYKCDENTSITIMKSKPDWTVEQQEFIGKMKARVEKVFSEIGLTGTYNYATLLSGTTNNSCLMFMNMYMDGLPLLEKDYGVNLQSSVNISNSGISQILFSGLLEIINSKEVPILSIDEVLEIIEQGVAEKSINTYSNEIVSIHLAYMVDRTDSDVSFYPVWCFDYCTDINENLESIICINAQSGVVEYMK